MPYEAAVRRWLARARLSREDIDDIVQEGYCRLAALDDVRHIERPDSYFFAVVRSELLRRVKRSRVIPIDAISGLDAIADERTPSVEREAAGRLDYARLRRIMATLPERCRRVVEMRKLEGWSQREIAAKLGVSESVVENQVRLGVTTIMARWREGETRAERRLAAIEQAARYGA